MSSKSKTLLHKYLNKIDNGDPSAEEDGDIDPRYFASTPAHYFRFSLLSFVSLYIYIYS